MKRYLCLIVGLCLLSLPASAQSERLNSLSEQLSTQANDLAEQSYSDYTNNSFSNRNEVETLYLVQQFSASANIFRRMVRDGRLESELRDAGSILEELVRRAARDFSRHSQWDDVQRTLSQIMRELHVGGSSGGREEGTGRGEDDNGGRTTGRVRWRGTVDDNIQLVVRDDRVEVRTIGGSEYNDASYNFTSPLPRRRVTVSATKINGRGDVRVLQQPSRNNDYTAVVQVRDPKGEAREYEIEVSW
jgi:hypothetical protein